MKKSWLTLLLAGAVVFAVALLFLYKNPSFTGSPNANSNPGSPSPPDLEALEAKATEGDAIAQNALGEFYMEGEGQAPDYDQAVFWLQMAADQNLPDAQFHLGELYQAGQGVTADLDKARALFLKAAEKDHPLALYNLGSIYGAGRGVDIDIPISTKYYMRSAALGDSMAQYNVGQRYEKGVGVEIDLVEAYKWYELSARQGLSDSQAARDKMTLSAEDKAKALQRVKAFLKPAADQ